MLAARAGLGRRVSGDQLFECAGDDLDRAFGLQPYRLVFGIVLDAVNGGRNQLDATTLYVNRGCGYVGPPVRIGAALEIAEITLRSAA